MLGGICDARFTYRPPAGVLLLLLQLQVGVEGGLMSKQDLWHQTATFIKRQKKKVYYLNRLHFVLYLTKFLAL